MIDRQYEARTRAVAGGWSGPSPDLIVVIGPARQTGPGIRTASRPASMCDGSHSQIEVRRPVGAPGMLLPCTESQEVRGRENSAAEILALRNAWARAAG